MCKSREQHDDRTAEAYEFADARITEHS